MKRKTIMVSAVLALLVLLIGNSLYSSKYNLEVSEYTINSDLINQPVRIVQLSDLHNSVFGTENSKLIFLVSSQNPDIILITGDLVNSNDPNYEIALNLVTELTSFAPVYISWGNHEVAYENNYGIDLKSLFEEAGADVMDYEYSDISVNGQELRLGGIYGYCLPDKYLLTNEADERECEFLTDFQTTDLYTILMCHMPVCWILNNGLDEWDVDCVISGHVHGGQIIIPFAGGVYAPDFGKFPGRLEGIYYSKDSSKNMVLSRGLGTVESIPRFNNIPEVVVVNYK